ncbi:MAG TPA: hypothetical protein ENO18_06335 [Caldithrix sp.]|nr:hypothetical protein [Caldithrix sp.]
MIRRNKDVELYIRETIQRAYDNYDNDVKNGMRVALDDLVIERAYYKLAYSKDQRYITKKVGENRGYPHIHMAIVFANRGDFNPEETEGRCNRLVKDADIFIDVDHRRDETKKDKKTGKKIDPNVYIHNYVLKDIRHWETYENLEYTNSVTLFNTSKHYYVYDMLYKYVCKNDLHGAITGVREPCKTDNRENVCSDGISYKIYDINFKKNDVNNIEGLLAMTMEKHDMRILACGRHSRVGSMIYQKVPGTNMTYAPNISHEELVGLCKNMYPHKKDLLTKEQVKIEAIFQDPFNTVLPSIDLDYQWIEFGDFYFHIDSARIVLEQNKYHCFWSDKRLTLRTLKLIAAGVVRPERYFRLLRHNGFLDSENVPTEMGRKVLERLRGLLVNARNKLNAMCLYGESGCGKTSLLCFLKAIYGDDQIGDITRDSFPCVTLIGKLIYWFEEFDPPQGFTNPQLLVILSPGTKATWPIKCKVAWVGIHWGNSVFTTNNIDPWAVDTEKARMKVEGFYPMGVYPQYQINNVVYDNLLSRVLFVEARKLPDEMISDAEETAMEKEEIGMIICYLCLLFRGNEIRIEETKNGEFSPEFKEIVRKARRRPEVDYIDGNLKPNRR